MPGPSYLFGCRHMQVNYVYNLQDCSNVFYRRIFLSALLGATPGLIMVCVSVVVCEHLCVSGQSLRLPRAFDKSRSAVAGPWNEVVFSCPYLIQEVYSGVIKEERKG